MSQVEVVIEISEPSGDSHTNKRIETKLEENTIAYIIGDWLKIDLTEVVG